MTWHEAMERFGTDKPDIRFGMELVDLGDAVRGDRVPAFHADAVKGICVPGQGDASAARRSTTSSTGPSCSARPGSCGCGSRTAARSRRRSRSSSPRRSRRRSSTRSAPRPATSCSSSRASGGMTNHVLGDPAPRPRSPAGERGRAAARCGSSTSRCSRRSTTDGRPIPAHHPFTSRTPTTSTCSTRRPARTCSTCARRPTTSCSTAGSSARAACGSTRPDVQQQIFSLLGIEPEEAQARFGFLLDAFRYGAPPHAGLRVRRRPARRAARGRGEHPRGHRVPEDADGRRPADRRARARSTRSQLRELGLTVADAEGPQPEAPDGARARCDLDAIDLTDLDRFADGFPHDDVHRAAPGGAGVVAGADRAHARRRGLLGDHPPRRRACASRATRRRSRRRPVRGATARAARSSRTWPPGVGPA